ncbi:MAG: 3-oxoacyl-[acyl-carrier-protein] reductase [Bacilli bacterium]
MNLSGKIAVVTGGATGIGRSISLMLAKNGATVIVNYNSSEKAALDLVNELKSEGHNCDMIKANISVYEDSLKLIDYVIQKYSRIDILVNNAGITKDNLLLRMSEEEFDQVITTNLKGTFNTSKHAIKYMTKQRYGKIINISSIVGLIGNAGQANYAASKAGIIGMSKSMARELAKRNITCNVVCPGFIKTKMTDVLDENLVNQMLNNIPLNRLGDPDDVANLVLFLASDKSNYITGQTINVDGGMVMY